MNLKSKILEAGRWVIVLAMIICLISLFAGSPASNAAFSDVSSAVLSQVDTTNMQQADNQMIKRLYGLDPSAFEGCILYYPSTNMDAEELLVIKMADTAQAESVSAAIKARLQAQKASFDGYGVEQTDLLTNYCVVDVRGNYALFLVSKTCDAAHTAFLDAL